MVPLAVCSRAADYGALTGRLRLRGAVVVQPLEAQHVDVYLARLGEPMAGVRALVREDAPLRGLLDTLLDSAADRILLRRVGGGWIVVHRLLLEHLADRCEAENPPPAGFTA